MRKSAFTKNTLLQGAILCLSLVSANCSGKTYSTFFQPFDLVFGAQSSSNSSVNGNLIAATPLTNTRVMLTFSKPVTLASGQTVANYRITGPNGNLLQILAASRDPNNSSIIFIDTIPQAAGSAYTVTVSGITFVDNASLGNATASFTAPNNADQTGPEFSSVSVTAATASAATLEVFFNEAVGQSVDDATFGGYFDLYTNSGCSTGHIDVTSAARDSSNYAKVTLTTANPLTAGIEYYACATTNVRDIWGNSKTTVIANGAVIVSSSFVYTAPTPRVTSAVSTSSTSVLVTFDQAMGTTGLTTTGNPGNYTFSSCGALANNTTGATITALNGNTQVLLTGLSAGTAGTCRVTVNTAVRSALGAPLTAQTNSAIFSYTTTDSTPPVVVSVAPTKRTVPTNLNPTNNIRVTFSEPIDLASVSTTAPFSDFSFSPALNIVSVNCTNTPVPYCDVETADQTTQSYGLTVSGISDPTGNALATSTTTFTGDGRPYIIAIYPVDTTTVMVQWSEPIGPRSDVDDTNSADGFDYSISPLVATDISEVRLFPTGGALSDYSAFVRIRLATAMTPGTSYTLAYSDTAPTGGTDASNNPPLTTVPNGGTFTGPGATSTAKPYIVSASSTATTTVIVNFNEPISNANLDPADFTLGGGSVCPNGTPASATQIAAGVVQLVVTAGTGGAGITCSVAVVADKFFDLLGNGNSATTPPHIEYSYSGTGAGADTTAPTIASIVSLSNTRIQVFFSEPMKTDPNGMDTLSLYSSSPALTFASVGTCVNGSTSCIINTSAQTAANYTLSISAGIQDSNNVATTGTITGTFIGTGGSATAPTLFMATLINSTTVELSFSEAMGLTSVECTSTGTCSGKYTVTGGNSVSAAVRQADPTKVRLTITPGAYGSSNSYTVTAAGVQDTAGNTIGTPNSATFSGSASAPNTTTLAAASDTGTLGDNITGAAFPSPGLQFTGTVAANTTVVLYLNGAPVATAVSGPTGAYTVTLTDGSGIVQGNGNVFTLTTVGPTGLVSDISPSLTITYDSNAPTVTTGLGNGVTSTLADGTYGIGQVIPITVKFSETVTVSGTPQLTIVRITPATTAAVNYASGSGTDTLTFNYTVLSGDSSSDLDYQATNSLALNGGTITDTAGNPAVLTLPAGAGSLASNKALVLNGVISGTITYDQSGITTGPFRTGTLTITATYASAPGSTPTIAIDQQGTNDIAATAMSGGPNVFTYSYTVNAAGGANADGTATITLSTPSVPATPTFVIDTTNPVAPAGITPPTYTNTTTATNVTYTNGTDTNFSTHNVRACTSNDCATGCVGQTTDAASPVDVSGLTNGTAYYICVQSVDTAGNISAYVASATTVTVDTTAPTAASGVSVPTYTQATNQDVTFTAGTDTNITTSNVRMCTSNDCTTGCVGATTGNSPTNVASLVNGTAYYGCVQSRDLAGNTSAWTASGTTVTVDTTNPTVPTGVSVPTYSSSTSADITFTAGTDTNITTSNVKMCTANDCTTGCVGATTSNSPATISGLTNGTAYYGCVQSRDLAGRTSAWVPSAATVTIDTTAPTVATGVSVPTWTTATSAAITFTAGTDTNITTSNLRMCTSNDCTTGCVGATTGNTGTSVGSLVNGTAYYGCVQSRDLAGNTAAWVASAATVTVDTGVPSAPSGLALDSADDTGSSNSDRITSQTANLTISGTSEANATVRLYQPNSGGTLLATTTANGSGNWSADISLAAGSTYTVVATARDAALNVSSDSTGISITVDNGAPSAPAAIALDSADDTGTSNSDGVTKNTTNLTFNGTSEANATVRLYYPNTLGTLIGTTTANGSGNWQLDNISLAASTYSVVATATDAAGNTSSASTPAYTLEVDTTAPTNHDTVYASSSARQSGAAQAIVTSGTASNQVWFAPSGTTTFTAGATMTQAGSGTATTINAPTTAGSYKLFVIDLAGNISSESTATLTVDNTAPTGYSVAIDQTYINNGNRTAISFTFTGAEVGTTYNYTFSSTGGGTNVTGNGTVASAGQQITGINLNGLGDGTVTLSVTLTDGAGNVGTAATNNKTKDTVLPVISAVSPTANFSNTNVSYTLSEVCQSGSITWTRTGGTADGGGSPAGTHTQALTGSELNAGTFTGTITNNPTLVDGTTYNITWNCTDLAGNVATTVTQSNLTYSPGNLVITSAETLDTDNDGKIDTYRLSFNKPVKDDTFNGYSANNLGSVTTQWLVAGYTNVRMIHGTHLSTTTSGAYTDTANDAVIYLRFDENVQTCSSASQVGCDTDAKPDVTTTGATISDFVQTSTLAQLSTGTVTEADGSKPVLIAARSLSTTTADAIFSEPVDTTTAQTITNYTISGGTNPTVSAATRDGTNTNIVHLTTGTQTGGQAYTLTVNTNVKDLANLSMNASANTANFNGVQNPVVSSVVTTSATTLTITFNETVTAASTECTSTAACAAIYDNTSIPILSAVSTGGTGVNSATFTLTVNPMVEGQSYTVTVLQNTVTSVATGNKMLNTNNSATFNGDGKPGASISTDTAAACPGNSARRVVVQYDQAVSATATTITNYKITGCISGASCSTGTGAPNSNGAATVTNQGGNKYAVDFTNNFATDATLYQLTISGVQDTNGNTIAAPGNFSFQCGTDTTAPVLISATVVTATAGSTVVLLTFSEPIDNVTGNTASNYTGNYSTTTPAWGTNVLSAARQSNNSQVLVTFQPALSNGGHQIGVRNVTDLVPLPIADNGTTNVQPIIVNAPTGFTGGPIFTDPFGDGTTAGTITVYDGKLYLGADKNSARLFEMNYSLTQAQSITLDGDGTFGSPLSSYAALTTRFTGCTQANLTLTTNPPAGSDGCVGAGAPFSVQGVDTLYAACVGGTNSTPNLTGTACTGAPVNGSEIFFIGARKTDNLNNAFLRSFWTSSTTSTVSTTFNFTERFAGDVSGGNFAFRAMTMLVFKDQLFINFGAEGGGGARGGRVCMNPAGCTGADNPTYLQYVDLNRWSRMKRIGANNSNVLRNGSYNGAGAPYADANQSDQVFNALTAMYEHDNDGTGSNPSQLYIANGGYTNSTLGSARTGNSDGGIMRTVTTYSTKTSLPANCPNDSSGCLTYFEDVTPDGQTKWNTYISIPYPQNTAASWLDTTPADGINDNCQSGSAGQYIEMNCTLPFNLFIPALKAVPYMRTAPNGDLYMIRNACSVNTFATNGGTNDFRTLRQVCPSGSEVPQLWMMPKNCGTAAQCAAAGTGWRLVAEFGSTGKTNMASNTGSCGTAPNKCTRNTHITLLEFVGNYLYVGWDNATDGANVWRTDMTSVASGSIPAETSFSIVNLPGIESGSGGTNQKIFSHVTVNEAGKDWLIIITRDGTSAMKIYRTANDQN